MGAGAVLTRGRLAPSEPAGPESSRGANFLPVRPRPVPQLWLPHSCHLLGSGQCVCAAAVRTARARLGSQTRVSLPVWPCSPCVRPGGGVTGGPGAGGVAPLCAVCSPWSRLCCRPVGRHGFYTPGRSLPCSRGAQQDPLLVLVDGAWETARAAAGGRSGGGEAWPRVCQPPRSGELVPLSHTPLGEMC